MGIRYKVVLVDNFSNSKSNVIIQIKEIIGNPVTFYDLDVAEKDSFRQVFAHHNMGAVIHFAGYKAVENRCLSQ